MSKLDNIIKKVLQEGDTYEKMAAKGKKAGNLKQGTVRKRLGIKKGEKIPLSKINKEISRLKKMDKDKDKAGVQLGDKNQKYYKALQLSKTLKTTTNVNEDKDYSKMHNVELNATYKNKLGVKDTKGLTRDDLIRSLKFHDASIKMFDGKKFDELDIAQKQKLLSYMNRDTEKEFERRMAMREEFSSTEQKMIKQIKSYKKRGSAMVTLPSKVRDFYFKNKEKIDALNEELKLGVKYELPTGETGYIMTGGSKDPKDWKFSANKEPYLSVKDKLKPTEKQPEKYDGAFDMGMGKGHHIDEGTNENINDPVLVKTRAAQMKRDAMDKKDLENKSKRISVDKAIDLRYELSILDKEREDILMRIEDIGVEMDQTAEQEGGPIADKLGERLMAAQRELRAIDSKIIDIKDDLGVFDMNEIVDEEIETSLTPNEIDDEAIEKESASPAFESLYQSLKEKLNQRLGK